MAVSHHQLGLLGTDYFDLLPDPILLSIFNRILDSKSLCRCLTVSKRFASLIPQIDSISVTIASPHHRRTSNKPINPAKLLLRVFVSKALRFLHRITLKKSSTASDPNTYWRSDVNSAFEIHHWNNIYLKNFSNVRSLRLELLCYGRGEFDGAHHSPLINWTAKFGKELQRCVIVAANSIQNGETSTTSDGDGCSTGSGMDGGDRDSLMSNEELKCRIMWIISCLLAASARHCLVKRMLVSCPRLSEVTISDAGKQGKLTMEEDDIGELRSWIGCSGGSAHDVLWQRSSLPDLVIKMWYAEELELPGSGYVLRGATVAAVMPAAAAVADDGGWRLEEECLGYWGEGESTQVGVEAVREMMKKKRKKVCKLEMTSF
ncbi:hypothetical protein Dimus_037660 [Dionaea muscipula]